MINPFITTGYAGPKYFCDRKDETRDLIALVTNGNNIVLTAPRRIGKTDLIRHCFAQEEIKDSYYTFIIDIYGTMSMSEFVKRMTISILETLKPGGRKVWEKFILTMSSLRPAVTYDAAGVPSFSIGFGNVKNPEVTLEELFHYLQNADKRCIVAIDEFQQIMKYGDSNAEAILRTHIQYCSNANFIYAGSQRHLIGEMFISASKPFYQSATFFDLKPIPADRYSDFCLEKFAQGGKCLDKAAVEYVYSRFKGITFYMQKVMNVMYMRAVEDVVCTVDDAVSAIDFIVDFSYEAYDDLMNQIPEKQRNLLLAVAAEDEVGGITSGEFVSKYNLRSPSSVQAAIKGLLEKDLLTLSKGVYSVYDMFFAVWLRRLVL